MVLGCLILRRYKIKGAMFALRLNRAMRHLKALKVCHSCRNLSSNHHTACSTRNTWLYSNNGKRSSKLPSTCNN